MRNERLACINPENQLTKRLAGMNRMSDFSGYLHIRQYLDFNT